jgi:hypothetical protein
MYPYFLALFSIGCFFLFISTFFIPMIVVAPRKCANLINVGSICIISSFAILKGPYKFLVTDNLLNKTRFIPAWLYCLSLLMTLWAAMIKRNYILTIISLSIEVICLIYFICSFFPGGN